MITIKNITKNIEHIVKPTAFPDGTQQVWKLPEDLVESGSIKIIWHYENDAEFITLSQVVHLFNKLDRYRITLVIPFLPYGRQDKDISNENTFGLTTFMSLIKTLRFTDIFTYDVHNADHPSLKNTPELNLKSVNGCIEQALAFSQAKLVCYPDKGASERGYKHEYTPSFHLSKTRDQSTGKITGMKCDLPLDLKGKKILIVDDICDGGRTFTEAAKILKSMGAESVSLYVTHGIFSSGIMFLEGIDHIYTTDSFKTKAIKSDKCTIFKLEI